MIVYYTTQTNQFFYEPELLWHSFYSQYSESVPLNDIKKCPSIADIFHNCYVIKNFVDYNITWDGKSFESNYYHQEFFNKSVIVRDPNIGLVSYAHPGIRFLAEKPLEMTLMPPWMHSVDIKEKAIVFSGKYDIGRHFRGLETAFLFTKKNSTIEFDAGSPQFYVKFHTKEKIEFKKFYYTEQMYTLERAILTARNGKFIKPLSFFYDVFSKNYRKKMFELIKQNLI